MTHEGLDQLLQSASSAVAGMSDTAVTHSPRVQIILLDSGWYSRIQIGFTHSSLLQTVLGHSEKNEAVSGRLVRLKLLEGTCVLCTEVAASHHLTLVVSRTLITCWMHDDVDVCMQVGFACLFNHCPFARRICVKPTVDFGLFSIITLSQ